MKIRTKLTLSYLLLITVIFASIATADYIFLREITRKTLATSSESIKDLTEKNAAFSEKLLTAYGEKIVNLKARSVANEISIMIGGKISYNYAELRADNALRAIATQNITTWNGVAGYVDILDNTGVAVIHPNTSVEGHNFVEWKDEFPEMWQLVRQAFTKKTISGYYSFIDKTTQKSAKKYMVLEQIANTPFIVAAAVTIDEYFLPVEKEIRSTALAAEEQANNTIEASNINYTASIERQLIIMAIIMFFAATAFALFLASSITRPILKLRDGVIRIGSGHFNTKVAEQGESEIKDLAHAFNDLGKRLKQHVEELKREVAARQSVESELRIGRDIQNSLLPHIFPPFPNRDDIDLYALNLAAKEVAGDFYDFFFVDDDTIALVIADVSGKGIPAALFMAVSRTLIRNIASNTMSPAETLTEVNRVICLENSSWMFVTVFFVLLDLKTGTIRYCNAGHNPPIIVKNNGEMRSIGNEIANVVIGAEETYSFLSGTTTLEDDETLVMYTDGVTEATNGNNELFGVDRFETILKKNSARPLIDITETLTDALETFQGKEQFDDITLLMARKKKRNSTISS